ncbi:MAG: glycosyltransferase family 39 protein, partial [Candidatus Gastranaerophilales bacterium]|nr:glycosyltransferase family 39 protein [Candidatus Gastranaerophilales bacterium]
MNKFLQKTSEFKLEDAFSNLKENIEKFIIEHPEIFSLTLLAIACIIFLFVGLGSYPLIDVDETRYAVISRDLINSFSWNNLELNMVPFLEKPPLYFWLVGASIKAFGAFSSFAVRFPIALLASFIVFFTYYVGKKIISRKFGVISALILLSSTFFLILSHVAIIDMVLTVFMTSAIYCGLLTHFCEEKNKKYCWLYFYIFIGLGFLAKGILAFAIPVSVVFIYNLLTGTAKDMFKPLNLIPGLFIFSILVLPWHV